MENPLISIIVPVYKAEAFLNKCVDSILSQTYRNIEVILVNDGSPDHSPELCDAISRMDERVIVIHKENGGQGSARNVGLAQAKGEYILFVDSDDWIHPESCKKLLSCAIENQCDIVWAEFVYVVGDLEKPSEKITTIPGLVERGRNFLVQNIKNSSICMTPCGGLYRKDVLIQNNLFFAEGYFHEDELWVPQVFLAAERVIYLDFVFYFYRYNANSTTKTKNWDVVSKRSKDLLFVCDELYKIYQKQPLEDRPILYNNLCTLFLNAVYIGNLKKESRIFPLRTATTARNRLKAMIHAISPTFYIWINKRVKGVRRK